MTKYQYIAKRWLFVALFLVSCIVSAQNFWFKTIGINDGLSSSQVNAILKDSKGFIWFGTSSGLDCYDGIQIHRFESNFSATNALPDSYILSLQESYDGNIWIETTGGYVVLDPKTLVFDRAVSQRLSMLNPNIDPEIVMFDHWQNLWVYDEGKALYYHKSKQQLVYEFKYDDTSAGLRPGTISGLCDHRDGALAVYTDGSVCLISGEQKKILWINDVIAKNTTQPDNYKVWGDDTGNLIVYGDMRSFFYDKSNAKWYRSLGELVRDWGGTLNIANELITSVATDKKGNVWISTDRHGLIVLQPSTHKVLAHVTSGNARSLTSNSLQTVYFDDTDLLWVGTSCAGVCYYAPGIYLFDTNPIGDVYGISEDIHGGLWLSTHNKGLIYFNPSDGFVTSYTQSQGLNDNMLSCVLAASDGTIWAGSNRFGLNLINSRGISTMQYSPGNKNGLKDNGIQALAEDKYNNIWIGSRKGGLQAYNTQTKRFSNFCVQNGKLPSDNVTSLSVANAKLVAGTTNGIMVLNQNNNSTKFYTGTESGNTRFTSNLVTQVFVDSRGIIWIGTREGLNAFDISVDQLSTFRTDDGLLSNVICGITEDYNHNIWVSTGRGVNRISVQNATNSETSRYAYTFCGYNEKDGLQGIEFNMGAILSTQKGKVYVGGNNGLSWVRNLKKIQRNRPVSVMLSCLTIDGQRIEVGEKYKNRIVLDRTLNSIETVKLVYGDSEIKFTLGVDDYNRAEPARFIFQLEGANENWLPVTGDGNTLVFKNIPSGNYTLHVKALLDNDETISEEHVLNIIVEKPWFKRWWMFVLFGIIVLMFIYLIYRLWPLVVGYHKKRKQEIQALHKKQDEIDDVAQEVRANVVSMIPQLGLLQMDINDPAQKEVVNGLHYKARQMLVSLNKLKENSSLMKSNQETDTNSKIIPATELQVSDENVHETLIDNDSFLICDYGIITKDGLQISGVEPKHTVFIVEKDADMLEFVEDCLKNTFKIRTFLTAEEFLEALDGERPSVIMCAEELTGMNGSALCENIKNNRSFERIPFVLTTDGILTQTEIYQKHITLLADDYIPSPYNLQSVIIRLNKILGEPLGEVLVDDTLRGAEAMQSAVNIQLLQLLDQYIRQNINRKELSIEEMAKVLNINRTVLFRKIESITGVSPTEHIRAIRLEEAAKLLESGYITAAEVAQELGFGNFATFSRFFQAEYGVLPSQYAEGIRQKKS